MLQHFEVNKINIWERSNLTRTLYINHAFQLESENTQKLLVIWSGYSKLGKLGLDHPP